MEIGVEDFFFFQAEDGIRDDLVTGVQTCALPISLACLNQISKAMLQQSDDRDARSFCAEDAAAQRDDSPCILARALNLVIGPAAFRPYQSNYLCRSPVETISHL